MPNDFHYQIIHLGYSKFFNVDDDSTWCNGQTFGKIPFSGFNPPKLTLDLRQKLNKLTDDLSSGLYAHLLGYANRKLHEAGRNGWLINRLWYGQYDNKPEYNFDGHRFCEKGVEDPKFQDPSTWIFGVWGGQPDSTGQVRADYFANISATSCSSDPKYSDDEAFAWDCDMAVYYASPGADQNAMTIPGFDFIRSFHPKSVGFTANKKYLDNAIRRIRKAPRLGEYIPAPGPDLNNLNFIPSDFPASLCQTATGTSGFATALGEASTTSANTAVSTPTATAPAGNCASKCDCGESSCTEDSPGCCPNGTCDQSC